MRDTDKNMASRHRAAIDARDWLTRLTSGSLSAAELQQFKHWRDCRPEHRAAFEKERVFWMGLDRLDEQLSHIASPKRPPLTRRAFVGGGSLAVGALASVVAAPRLSLWWNADVVVPAGNQRELAFADGTVAALNTGGAIKIDFRPGMRLVHLLQGDAEFLVPPAADGSVFRVASGGGNTDIQHGRLLVSAREDLTAVATVIGDASVYSPVAADEIDVSGRPSVKISPAEQTSYRFGEIPDQPTVADLEMLLAWRHGRMILESKPFAAAIAEIGRYVPEAVILRPGVDRDARVSGIFSTTKPLAALQSIAKTQALSVRRIPGIAIVLA